MARAPPPPRLFTTTMSCLRVRRERSIIIRELTSVPPPAPACVMTSIAGLPMATETHASIITLVNVTAPAFSILFECLIRELHIHG